MEWIKVKFSDFLQERKGRYKPDDVKIKHLKRIDKIDFSGQIYLSNKPSKTDMILVKDGDLVISGINVEKGAMNIFHGKEDVIATIHYSSYTYDTNVINLEFLKHFLKSKKFKDVLKEQTPGGIKTEIKPKHLLPLEIYIPKKLDNQKKIVQHLDKLYENLNNLNFEITHQLDLIKDLRQAFLREAMQGLLVSNETSDGKSGADLLAEIQAEKAQMIKEKKIKKPKPLAPITQEEIPFEIPENWTWCRLGEISEIERGSSPRPKGDPKYFTFEKTNYNWITISDITNFSLNGFLEKTREFLTEEGSKFSRYVRKNEFIIAVSGSTTGKCCLTKIDGFIYDGLALVRLVKQKINSNYLLYYFNNIYNFINSSKKGAAFPNINTEFLNNLIFSIPPLETQERIVSKLNELMTFCDQLEEQIKQNQQTNDLLLQQVLREALGEKKEEKGELTELQLVAEPIEQYIAKQFTAKTCDKNDMAVLTGYIIQELNTKDFGRVKLQKMLHLVEYHCQLETNFNYYKKVAGPHAEELKESIEPILQRNRLFDIKKEKLGNKEKVNYTALAGASQINKFFNSDFKEQKENIDFVLHKFRNKTWNFCEMISTMYAVWNNRLIKQQSITDDDLKKDFLEWDKEKIKFVDKLDYAIEWIKKENMEPKGLGKYIDKPQTK
ncbi:restriction endonuclease subunit S [uncultured Elizabethkingia sp.]|uniref:restriction endonuclease subunit S n=1 Tax=uncultured Elizabethkingia sp. TaxID=432638 RepID=UPI002593B284|nr:restriction endonuclease subunit S [uncultured Elizabethkingia sp.]